MKAIFLGTKDYIKDCWHDWLSNRLHKVQGERIYTYDAKEDLTCWVHPWKEGSVFHYIKQRRIGKKAKLTKWNVQDYLKTNEDVFNYLAEALKYKDDEYLRIAVKDAIKALKRLK